MKARERILQNALTLFNQDGTAAISTNHIAEAAGVSPGNLYYHFRNKEEIIRALFEQLFHLWDVKLVLPDDRVPTLDDVETLVRVNFGILWNYRFAYREMVALLRQDAALQERYIAVRERGYYGFRQTIEVMTAAGVLPPVSYAEDVTRLADLCWLISEFWLAMLEMSGQPVTPEQIERGIKLMLYVIKPV